MNFNPSTNQNLIQYTNTNQTKFTPNGAVQPLVQIPKTKYQEYQKQEAFIQNIEEITRNTDLSLFNSCAKSDADDENGCYDFFERFPIYMQCSISEREFWMRKCHEFADELDELRKRD